MTTTNPANPLQSLMDHLSKQLDANAKDANDRASKISDLAARYAAACKEDALSVLAARLTDAPPPTRSADDAALVLWEAVQQLPEIQRLSNTSAAPVIPIKSAPTATEADYPRVRVACTNKPLVVVGGHVPSDRINWVRNRTVKTATWHLITRERDQKETDAIVARITSREYAVVVIVESDIRQPQRTRIESVCMRTGIPWVLAESGGTDALSRALEEMDLALAKESAEAR